MKSSDFLALLFISALISAFMGAVIGSEKGRGLGGFVLGLILGPFGVVAVAAQGLSISKQWEAERRLAAVFGMSEEDRQHKDDLRAWAVSEAIRRDSSLGEAEDSATLRRLATEALAIEAEAEIKFVRDRAMQPR